MKKIGWLIVNIAAVVSVLIASANAWGQLGSADKDIVFSPVTPCRILDTRNTSILSAGETRGFNGPGVISFQSQGGSAGNCNLLKNEPIAALVINFTIVNPSNGGYITAFPTTNSPRPLAATVNFSAGDVLGNNAVVKLSENELSYAFNVYTTAQTHLVADVVGYFNAPPVSKLHCYTTPQNVGQINVPNSGLFLGNATAPACAASFSSAGTSCVPSSPLVNLTGIAGAKCDANHFFNTETIAASQRCCRVSGR